MDADEVLALLRQKIAEAGSQADFVRAHPEVSQTQVSQVLCGVAKAPGPSILNALGLRKVVKYEPIK